MDMDTQSDTCTLHMRRVVFGTGIVIAFLLLFVCTFLLYFNARIEKLESDVYNGCCAPASVPARTDVYTLREYRGKIGIFEEGKSTPLQVLDVYVFTLPEADRASLRTGIRVISDDALRSLIEDFTG